MHFDVYESDDITRKKRAEQIPLTKIKAEEKKETTTESKNKDTSRKNVETTTIVKDTTYEERIGQKNADEEALFKKQVSKDYYRVKNNFPLVVLLTIVIGLIIYEIGFRVLIYSPSKGGDKLFRYDSQYDSEEQNTHKFNFTQQPVGLVYFAPFLKEKFSGDENYYSFLITEYYRFLEFSIIMPISLIVAGILGLAYYLLFCIRNDYAPYYGEFAVFFIILFVVSIGFLYFISPKINDAYNKASKDLIQGVSDFMKKGLVK